MKGIDSLNAHLNEFEKKRSPATERHMPTILPSVLYLALDGFSPATSG